MQYQTDPTMSVDANSSSASTSISTNSSASTNTSISTDTSKSSDVKPIQNRKKNEQRLVWSIKEDIHLLMIILENRECIIDTPVDKDTGPAVNRKNKKKRGVFWALVSEHLNNMSTTKTRNITRNKRQCKDRFALLYWKKYYVIGSKLNQSLIDNGAFPNNVSSHPSNSDDTVKNGSTTATNTKHVSHDGSVSGSSSSSGSGGKTTYLGMQVDEFLNKIKIKVSSLPDNTTCSRNYITSSKLDNSLNNMKILLGNGDDEFENGTILNNGNDEGDETENENELEHAHAHAHENENNNGHNEEHALQHERSHDNNNHNDNGEKILNILLMYIYAHFEFNGSSTLRVKSSLNTNTSSASNNNNITEHTDGSTVDSNDIQSYGEDFKIKKNTEQFKDLNNNKSNITKEYVRKLEQDIVRLNSIVLKQQNDMKLLERQLEVFKTSASFSSTMVTNTGPVSVLKQNVPNTISNSYNSNNTSNTLLLEEKIIKKAKDNNRNENTSYNSNLNKPSIKNIINKTNTNSSSIGVNGRSNGSFNDTTGTVTTGGAITAANNNNSSSSSSSSNNNHNNNTMSNSKSSNNNNSSSNNSNNDANGSIYAQPAGTGYYFYPYTMNSIKPTGTVNADMVPPTLVPTATIPNDGNTNSSISGSVNNTDIKLGSVGAHSIGSASNKVSMMPQPSTQHVGNYVTPGMNNLAIPLEGGQAAGVYHYGVNNGVTAHDSRTVSLPPVEPTNVQTLVAANGALGSVNGPPASQAMFMNSTAVNAAMLSGNNSSINGASSNIQSNNHINNIPNAVLLPRYTNVNANSGAGIHVNEPMAYTMAVQGSIPQPQAAQYSISPNNRYGYYMGMDPNQQQHQQQTYMPQYQQGISLQQQQQQQQYALQQTTPFNGLPPPQQY